MNKIAARSFLLVTFWTLFLATSAQYITTVLAVEVEPARLELTIPMDQPTQGDLKVTNHAKRAVDVRISTGPYRFFQPGLRLPSAERWFRFEPEKFTLAPGASSTVTFSITPPSNVIRDTAGEYLAAILIDELPAGSGESGVGGRGSGETLQTASGTITLVPRFALPVYLKIQGRERTSVILADVSVRLNPTPEFLKIEVVLKNEGSVHVRPTGTVAILQPGGGLVSAYPLGKGVPLLPTATLKVPTLVPLPSPGQYKAVVTVEVQPGELLQKEVPFEVTPEGDVR